MANKLELLGSRQSVTLNRRGIPVRIIRIDFMVGENGPFYVELPAADFTAAKGQAAVEAMAAELIALHGFGS